MKSNFEFLGQYWPALAAIGKTAESYLYMDANGCIYKLGLFGERVVKEIFAVENLPLPENDDTQAGRIRVLKRERLLPTNMDDILYVLRKRRNDAVHAGLDSLDDAKTLLESTYRLAVWFMEVYGDWKYTPEPFVLPVKEPDVDYVSIIEEQERKIAALGQQVTAAQTAAAEAERAERQGYEKEIAALNEQIAAVQASAEKAARAERQDYEKEIAALNEQITAVQASAEKAAMAERQGYEKEIAALNEQIAEVQASAEKAAVAERQAYEREIAALSEQVTAVQTAAAKATRAERQKQAEEKAAESNPSEAETRLIIDAQLRDAGWEADTAVLRYSKGTRPVRGRNIAIAEWPTQSVVDGKGYADYALFIGTQMVGIIEAKRLGKDVAAVVDNQCVEYGQGIRPEDYEYCVGEWNGYHVPFLFATNSRKYFEQLKTKSGIWFRDVRLLAYSRALRGWYSPEGLKDLLTKKNEQEADRELENTPMDVLRDPDGLALRPYQIRAIEKVEEAIRSGRKAVLLAMATGTGKTRVVTGMIYRFLSTGRFKRILFLVDRNALGEQADDKFKNVKIEQLLPLTSIFDVSNLEEKGFNIDAQVKIATVQSMVRHVMGDGTGVSVSEYDLIIVDEAHRGYLLDKEMSDTEILYRDEGDYLSKYKMVIDYFDAVKIGLTATPALQTVEIFGHAVFTYSYREAVVDGFLCDQNEPHDIMTKLRMEGIHYKKGDRIVRIHPVTGELLNGEELPDDLDLNVDVFNRQVVTPGFNKTVLEEVSKYLDPEGEGKTLIYAVTDEHADMVVEILRDIYRKKDIPDKAVRKITGSIGDKTEIRKAIKEFENEKYPNIVVTVDLLTTGIDIPQITSLVFLRLVKSRILFEQMLGRATRKCDDIGKEAFDVYDCVGVYQTAYNETTMKSVTPRETFGELIGGLDAMTDPEHIRVQVEKVIAKMRRRMKFYTKKAREQFADLAGGVSVEAFAGKMASVPCEEAKALLMGSVDAFKQLDQDSVPRKGKIFDDREDELISHTVGYGSGQKPEDYLESFGEFVRTHVNEIDALRILVTRPSDLTRAGLRSLKLELDRHHYNEKQLSNAWKAVTNQEITADIIAFVRQQALGSPLVSQQTRIKHAFARLKEEHDFDKNQLNWLKRIESTLLQESVLDVEMFNEGAFRTNGGFNVIDRRFGGRLKDILAELNDYIYDDGQSA